VNTITRRRRTSRGTFYSWLDRIRANYAALVIELSKTLSALAILAIASLILFIMLVTTH
jgi:hypothetical protein